MLKSYDSATFQATFASQGVLNKDPTIWLDGVRPAHTCIPPFFHRNAPVQLHDIPIHKNTFASIKN
jgi:hypothetical protein